MEIPSKIYIKILYRRHITDKGCWEWLGIRNRDGYGYVSVDGRKYLIHRYVYCILNDVPLETPFRVLHRCDNPPCFNPEHLFKGTSKENTKDAVFKGRFGSNRGKDWRNR